MIENDVSKKKKNRFYCIQCLCKFYRNNLAPEDKCPHCVIPARANTTRIVAQIVTRLRRQRGLEPYRLKTEYQEYMASELWRTIRERIMERDRWTCQACGRKATVVHHKSYDREVLDGNRDSDLIAICNHCHQQIEFTFNDGSRAKNSLAKANAKLARMIEAFSGAAKMLEPCRNPRSTTT